MISPTPGSTLRRWFPSFKWTAVGGGLEYRLDIGTSAGGTQVYSRSLGTRTSVMLWYLPGRGGSLYVRLWTRTAAGWAFNDYQYAAPP
jgi:hypothetical protein